MHTDFEPEEILVVEDDRFFRELYADLLMTAGYPVTTAAGGEEALALLQGRRFGLVISDLAMPCMNGLELLTRVKAQDPSRDLIMVTAHADLSSALFALRHGARDYLLKPINAEEFLHAVRLCMEQRRLVNENVALRNMVSLLQTSQALSGCLDLDGVCHLTLEAFTREAAVTRGALLVRQDAGYQLQQLRGVNHELGPLMETLLPPLAQRRARRKEQPYSRILLPFGHQQLEQADLREALLIPLRAPASQPGTVLLFNEVGQAVPAVQNLRSISFLEEHAARALENALRFSTTQDMLYLDELSGLFNYRYLKVALEREIKRADRYTTKLSVLFLDLDNFKSVNDVHGHLVGSSLLRELGHLLKRAVREVDIVIRYGGDEYTVLLVETDAETALKVGERLRRRIEQHRFLGREGYQLQLTASLGVACYPDDTTGLDELLALADKAMYAGKAAGKNCVYRVTGTLKTDEEQ